jgi:7,8-dihydro-6-hydroxymethylpterin-pyrophosphokinase
MVAEIRSEAVTPTQMMARLLRIEYLLGRTDKSQRKPRTIDLDILFFGDVRLDTPFLTIPHPRIQLRRFVLVPMNDVAPHFSHPLIHKDIRALLNECEDRSSVVRWNPMGQHSYAQV